MKQINDIKKHILWEEYYNPEFDWRDWDFYANNTLSEDFIREFKDKVDWMAVCRYQKLSEDFIREFQDKIQWGVLSVYHDLSDSFKTEFSSKLIFTIANDNIVVNPDDTTQNRIQINRQIFDRQLLDNSRFLNLQYKMTQQLTDCKIIISDLANQLHEQKQLTTMLLSRLECLEHHAKQLEQKNSQLQLSLTNLRMWGC